MVYSKQETKGTVGLCVCGQEDDDKDSWIIEGLDVEWEESTEWELGMRGSYGVLKGEVDRI